LKAYLYVSIASNRKSLIETRQDNKMKICIAQIRPVKGETDKNIEIHKKFIDLAISKEADMIFFPELSLTGYEPKLAKNLATTQDDKRFDDFQNISDSHNITIGVGMPTKSDSDILISTIIFQPHESRLLNDTTIGGETATANVTVV
jgi:predicted amidohydrolase